jgi:putative spermidine/putrescine transport system ATP-binding protein
MSDAFVELKNLTLSYGNSVAVPALDLAISEGELITLLGPSGCGKTTTMRAIAGLLAPPSGTIHIDGRDVTRVPANKRGIGLVFQSYALFPHLNAFENVAFGLRLQKLPDAEIRSRTAQGLDTVGLAGFDKRKPAEMSGGQQQRLALARSLVMRPKVLLLDEPLSNLDARLRLEMRTELQRVQKETGVTMVFVTHDQAEALALADRIVLMSQAKLSSWAHRQTCIPVPGRHLPPISWASKTSFRSRATRLSPPTAIYRSAIPRMLSCWHGDLTA